MKISVYPSLPRLLLFAGLFNGPILASFGQDSVPVLVSTSSGEGQKTWANPAELAAAADHGNPVAQAQLGEMLLRGGDIPKDGPRALALLERAARAGEASAAFRLGMLLDDGDSVARDRVRALAYFRAAAVGGVAEAYYNVGAAYVGAHGIKRNYPEGLAWLILARKHGADGEAEETVRARITRLRHPEWITAGETRASELEIELRQSTVIAQLPPPATLQYVPNADLPKPQ